MKYYIIAGERSGDLHASNLMKELKVVDSNAEFRFYGGDKMIEQGGECVRHYSDMAFMGIWEIIKNLRTLNGYINECKKDLSAYKPDVLILVDYAGFNMKIAKFAFENNLKTFYYISPKVWAWRTKRALKIKKYVNELFTILPFETEFFKQFDYKVNYVGNPSFDEISNYKPTPEFHKNNELDNRPILTLLPGSRKQELLNMLPIMVETAKETKSHQVIVGGVNSLPKEIYQPAFDAGIKVVFDQSFDLLANTDKALVCSGTASLETCLFKVPHVVCYKTSFLTAEIVRRLLKVKYASLVNLIVDKLVVTELIQENFTLDKVKQEFKLLMNDKAYNEKIKKGYDEVFERIGLPGAAKRCAETMYNYLKE